jgi:hypothetical protein
VILKPGAKLALTVVLFLVAVGTVVVSASIHEAGPLFFAWVPLLVVAWVLTRAEEPLASEPTTEVQASEPVVTSPVEDAIPPTAEPSA